MAALVAGCGATSTASAKIPSPAAATPSPTLPTAIPSGAPPPTSTPPSPGARGPIFPGLAGTFAIGGKDGHIYTMAADGRGLRRLTNQSGVDFDPSWSPDGRAIVFRTSRGHYAPDPNGTGTEGILVVDATSGEERQLFPPGPGKVGGLFPDWAPSGKQVALATLDDKQRERIDIIDATSGALLRLLPTAGECIDWSPDGKQLSFCAHGAVLNDWDIYVIGTDGSGLRQLTSTPERQYGGLWSADGKRLLYQQYSADGLADIWVMTTDGNDRRQLTSGRGIKAPDVWLPDGRIIFESWAPDAPFPSWFIMAADGSQVQAVGQLDALQTGGPIDWRP